MNNKGIFTGLECPCSSVVEPTLGGSTIISYIMPTNFQYDCEFQIKRFLNVLTASY